MYYTTRKKQTTVIKTKFKNVIPLSAKLHFYWIQGVSEYWFRSYL